MLLAIGGELFVVCCWLVIDCCLFVVGYGLLVLFVFWYWLSVVGCLVFEFVLGCWLFVVCCSLSIVCCWLLVSGCWLPFICCLLLFVGCLFLVLGSP